MHPVPPGTRYPTPWHTCAHPWRHRLLVGTLMGSWLYAALRYGLPWAVSWSQVMDAGWRPLWWCVYAGVWLFVILPVVTGGLYVIVTHDCGPWPAELGHPSTWPTRGLPQTPVGPGQRTIERIILSPEAAEHHCGIRGTITFERETEGESHAP